MEKFKYDAVLKYRKFQEEQLQRELFDEKCKLIAERQCLENLEKELETSRETLKKTCTEKPLNSEILLMHERFLDQLCIKITQQIQIVKDQEEQYHGKRAEVLEAMKNRKSLEKVKENWIEEKIDLERKQQAKFLDELGVNRFIREQKSGADKCKQ